MTNKDRINLLIILSVLANVRSKDDLKKAKKCFRRLNNNSTLYTKLLENENIFKILTNTAPEEQTREYECLLRANQFSR